MMMHEVKDMYLITKKPKNACKEKQIIKLKPKRSKKKKIRLHAFFFFFIQLCLYLFIFVMSGGDICILMTLHEYMLRINSLNFENKVMFRKKKRIKISRKKMK